MVPGLAEGARLRAGGAPGCPQMESERLPAFRRAGPGVACQVGQGPGNPDHLVRRPGADLPEIHGAAKRRDGLGSRRVETVQLGAGNVGIDLPGCAVEPVAGAITGCRDARRGGQVAVSGRLPRTPHSRAGGISVEADREMAAELTSYP